MNRIPVTALTVGLMTLTAAAAVVARGHPDESVAGRSGALLTLEVATAAVLVANAALVNPRLLAAAVAVDLQALPLPYAGGAVLFTAALVLAPAAVPLALAPLVRRPLGAALIAVAVVWAGLVPTMLFDARSTGCFACPRNLLEVDGDAALRSHVLSAGLRAAAAALLVAAGALALRMIRSRRRPAAVTAQSAGAIVSAVAAAVLLAHDADGSSATDRVSQVAWAIACCGMVVLAAAPVVDLVRAWLETIRMVDAVLAAVPSQEALRATLAVSAADDGLAIEIPGAGQVPRGASTTEVVRAGNVIARLHHRELERPIADRLAAAVRAAGLAIEHVAARARLRAQLDELTASRGRIVEVADAERRRLERDLHDGAQQRLIALSVALAGRNAVASEARAEILAALEDLRTLAHGIHPASLTEGGVASSTRELADAARVPLRLDVRPVGRLPAAVETAAYRVIADSVRAAEQSGRAVDVELSTTDRRLDAQLRLCGLPTSVARRALSHAIDRVIAVGGTVDVREGTGETIVDVRIECGS